MAKHHNKNHSSLKEEGAKKAAADETGKIILTKEDLDTLTGNENGALYFLNHYSRSAIEKALDKYGLYGKLREKGFQDFNLVMDTRDPYRQRLRLYVDNLLDQQHLLCELIVRRTSILLTPYFFSPLNGHEFDILFIEWIALQNPFQAFSRELPRLPGQEYPGLGVGWLVMKILTCLCETLRMAGIGNIPGFFHSAWMYSKNSLFVDPLCEGKQRALKRDLLNKFELSTVSWAIEAGCVSENGQPFSWFTSQQLAPFDPDLKAYFKSPQYCLKVKESLENHQYHLDEKCWEKKSTDKILSN